MCHDLEQAPPYFAAITTKINNVMKQLVLTALTALTVLTLSEFTSQAQNVTATPENGPAYIGASREIDMFDGSIVASLDYSSYGIAVGAYDDSPDEIVTELVIYTRGSSNFKEINPNSKLILKVNGENMILTTTHGTNWVGSHQTGISAKGVMGALSGQKQVTHIAEARYPITGEQLEKLMKYGFSKYRFQVVGSVNEGEFSERKQNKIARKLSESYNEVRSEQATISNKVNDLSDF